MLNKTERFIFALIMLCAVVPAILLGAAISREFDARKEYNDADINHDGKVDAIDLDILLRQWTEPTKPNVNVEVNEV